MRQRTQLTGPNRPSGAISIHARKSSPDTGNHPPIQGSLPETILRNTRTSPEPRCTLSGGTRENAVPKRVDWTTWWPWRGAPTRSHPELGRENPQRPWYCVSRHGRVGRRQVFQSTLTHPTLTTAGWSSPVARQAHNLKVIGSNPIPATKIPKSYQCSRPLRRSFPFVPTASQTVPGKSV